ncbi:MAG: tetratricopeptide repeat protein [Tepidisphaeraceae bacterium]
MKAEERHALKQNDLASGASGMAELWRKHGNKVLIVLAVAFLVLAAVRYKRAQAAQQAAQSQAALVSAWNGVQQVKSLQLNALLGKMDVSKQVEQLESDVNQSVQLVIDNSDASTDATRLASAWLARGELFWDLSQLPAASAATQPSSTQPALATKTPAQYMDLANNAYQQVVNSYPGQHVPVTIARFGLAAIAENKGDFATARTQYKALIEDTNLTAANKSLAEMRLAKLDELEKPMLLLPATQPATKPAMPLSTLPPLDLHMGPQVPTATTKPATTQP